VSYENVFGQKRSDFTFIIESMQLTRLLKEAIASASFNHMQIHIQHQISILPRCSSYPSPTPMLKELSKSNSIRTCLANSVVALIKEEVVVVGVCQAIGRVDGVDEERGVVI
jgi:hypothetical protein